MTEKITNTYSKRKNGYYTIRIYISLFFIKTSHFGAEAERFSSSSFFFFLRFEPESNLNMFLKCGIVVNKSMRT